MLLDTPNSFELEAKVADPGTGEVTTTHNDKVLYRFVVKSIRTWPGQPRQRWTAIAFNDLAHRIAGVFQVGDKVLIKGVLNTLGDGRTDLQVIRIWESLDNRDSED